MSFLSFRNVPRAIRYLLAFFTPGHNSTSEGCNISTSCPSSFSPFVQCSLVLPEPRWGSRKTDAESESIFIQEIGLYRNSLGLGMLLLCRLRCSFQPEAFLDEVEVKPVAGQLFCIDRYRVFFIYQPKD